MGKFYNLWLNNPSRKILLLFLFILVLITCKIHTLSYSSAPLAVFLIRETIFLILVGTAWTLFWAIIDRINHHAWRFIYYIHLYLVSVALINLGTLLNLWLSANHLLPKLEVLSAFCMLSIIAGVALYLAIRKASKISRAPSIALVLGAICLAMLQQVLLPKLSEKNFYAFPKNSRLYIPSYLIVAPISTQDKFLQDLTIFNSD